MIEQQQTLFNGSCEHDEIEEIILQSGPHYGMRRCNQCKKFLGWIPKPENVARQVRNQEILTALSKLELGAWERQFIRTLASTKNISPKQQAKLLELEEIYLKK